MNNKPNIYISLPTDPFSYDRGNKMSWSQIYKFIYEGLVNEFGQVNIIPYSFKGSLNFREKDFFITTLSDEPIINHILKFPRCILIDNNNFDVNKWKFGKFSKFGYTSPTSLSSRFDNHIKSSLCQFVKTNDVAISKWETDHPDVYEYKKWYIDNNVNVKLMQHPIDKKHYGSFYNDQKITDPKMIIYHAGPCKNAKQLIETLVNLGFIIGRDFDMVGGIDVSNPKPILNKYSYFAHTSFSEGFPYLLNEFFTMGMFPFANDEWWSGLGRRETLWSYDPALQERNVSNLKYLFDKNNLEEINNIRKEVWQKHMDREDNNWDYFVGELIKEMRKNL